MTTLARPRLDPLIDAPLVGPRVLSLVGQWAISCNLWRVWQPTRLLQRRGYFAEWGWYNDPKNGPLLPYFDAFVLCRIGWSQNRVRGGERTFAGLRSGGGKVFYECDDDLLSPGSAEHQHRGMQDDKTRKALEDELAWSRWTVERCDGVTVSTQYLASTVRRYTAAPVEVVPNMIAVEWFRDVQARVCRLVPPVTIGWAGGKRPDRELLPMAEAWARVARRYPHVRFLLVGHHPRVVSKRLPPDRLHRVPWLAVDDYPMGLVGIDIGCCPLERLTFNLCKSPIKSWEYGLSGAAVVASPTVYRECVDHGRSGYLAETADEWEEALSRLVEREEERRAMAAALERDVVERWSLERNVWRWPAAWHRLMGGEGAP